MLGLHLDLGKIRAYGSAYLASILYQNENGDFIYTLDSSSNMILDNQSMGGESNDGLLYSGRGIELGATNDVDIPIHHTLGAEELTNGTFDTDTDWAKGTGWTISAGTANCDGTQTASSYLSQVALTAGETYLISYDVTSYTAGNIKATVSGAEGTNHTSIGTYTEILTATNTSFGMKADIDFIGSIDNVSVKQITNPNSYLTYYDFTDGLVTLGNSVDGGSSVNLTPAGDFEVDSGITKYNGAIVGGGILASGSSANAGAGISFTAEIGETYIVVVDLISVPSTDSISLFIQGLLPTTTIGASAGTFISSPIVATSTTHEARILTNVSGKDFTADNLKVYKILPISTKYTLNTKTVNNVITHTTPWSASDWTRINNNPNLIGKLAIETLGATKTIPELDMVMDAGASADSYYMCSEKSGAYLVDSRDIGISNADIIGQLSAIDGVGNTLVADTNTHFTIHQEVATPSTGRPYTYQQVADTTKAYILTRTVTCTLGVIATGPIYSKPSTTGVVGGNLVSAGETLVESLVCTAGIANYIQAWMDGDHPSNVYPNDYTVSFETRQATATEIANYASTVRTNADLQQKGIQQTAFVTDGAGVPTAYSGNLLQFNGDGRYVDTGWIPSASEDWTIELVQNFILDSNFHLSGNDSTTNRVYIGESSSGGAYYAISESASSVAVTSGLHHLVLTYNSATKIGSAYKDGVYLFEVGTGTFAGGITQFIIGQANSTYLSKDSIGLPVVYRGKILTATEVSTAYAKAKAIYTTLP